ncbi:hypothetical protein [Gordonia aurantiaca]|uniref:hypothetical protein n=1 Tax=Gordonia sp. B21 TaxID=3151852 RepID=UPI003266BF4F
MGRKITAALGALAAFSALSIGAASAHATPGEQPLSVDQVPNAGITVGSNGISGGFAASILASATVPGVTQVALDTMPTEACATNLRGARVGISWTNKTTGATGSKVFDACSDGRPADGVALETGAGKVEFTTTIIGQNDQTFTVVPGSGSFTR